MNEPVPTTISDATLAEFARVALSLDLISVANVIAWADDIILKSDEPPYWAIELAEATSRTLVDALKSVPGQADKASACVLLATLLRRRWLSNDLDWRAVRWIADDLAYRTFQDDELPDWLEMQLKSLSGELEYSDEYDLVTIKRLPPENPAASIMKWLLPFEKFELRLPWWVLRKSPRSLR